MLKGEFKKHILHFRKPSGTSRGIIQEKTSWFLRICDSHNDQLYGTGEVGFLRGLSVDHEEEIENILMAICHNPGDPNWLDKELYAFPAVRFALEQALIDFDNGGQHLLFPSDFTEDKKAIPINGLVWMGSINDMRKQVREKIENGFTCVKLKIGALNFEDEFALIKEIRNEFSPTDIEIRVDANGAFSPKDALHKLEQLALLQIHSIEQPIAKNQHQEMAQLCRETPLPIALDEELIGIAEPSAKEKLLGTIRPQFIILKPSLTGGFRSSEEWIHYANRLNIGWWVTSALESNVGLNAIAQWTATLNNPMPQGLGTGQLYTNNIASPLEVRNGKLHYNQNQKWQHVFA